MREALPAWLDEQVGLGNLRQSTAVAYKCTLAKWLYPRLGTLPWNAITREDLGEVLLAVRRAQRGIGVLEHLRSPLARFYDWQRHVHRYDGPNPAADLRFFLPKKAKKKAAARDLQWFPKAEAQALLDAARVLRPRWYPFLL